MLVESAPPTTIWQAPAPIDNPMDEFVRSFAVTIGIDDYGGGIPQLRTAAGDARLLASLLQTKHGYQVACLTQDVTQARLETLFCHELPARLGNDDRLLIYFAGHGVALDGDDGPRGYLLPQDARADDPDSFLRMHLFRQWIDALSCRHLLLILDCCFAGAFRWSGTRDTRRIADQLPAERYHHYLTSRAWQVITSAAHNQRAYDEIVARNVLGRRGETSYAGAPHSPFALALFQGMDGHADLWPKPQGDGVITVGELQVHLSLQVAQVTRNAQTPQLWPLPQHDCGEYIFLIPGRRPTLRHAEALRADNSPWRGLRPYGAEHADIFCGRDALAKELTRKVSQEALPLVVVVGGSGAGKSSLVRAGLLPRLQQMQTAAGAPRWHILAAIRPGSEPVRTLVETVSNALADAAAPGPAAGEDHCQWCIQRLRTWLETHPDRHLLLFIDQFEEIITFCKREGERRRFLQLLGRLMEQQFDRLHVVITLRADFEPHFHDAPFPEAWQAGRFLVHPMSTEELREVVEGPAAVREIYFESSKMVNDLVDEVAQTPGALPLLSFTLHELYLRYLQRQDAARQRAQIVERALSLADYQALGGVVGALGRRAGDLFNGLSPDEQATMRRIMLRMVATEGSELSRRRAPLWELEFAPSAEARRVQTVVERLVQARLVVRDWDAVARETYVEPAHDALTRAWDRILQWRDEAGDLLPLQRRLTRAAGDWQTAPAARKQALLWTNDARLPQVHQMLAPQDYAAPTDKTETGELEAGAGPRWGWWRLLRRLFNPTTTAPTTPTGLNRVETAFVQQSVRRRALALRRIALTVAATLVVLAALAGIANWQRGRAEANRLASLQEESRRLAVASLSQLAVDPAGALETALGALPADGTDDRPYVPQAEFALTQALRADQELAAVAGAAQTPDQVAITGDRILLAGNSLALYDHELGHQVDLAVGAVAHLVAPHDISSGPVIAYGGRNVYLVADDRVGASLQLGEGQSVECATWQPDSDAVILCAGVPGAVRLWRWTPDRPVGPWLEQVAPALDAQAVVAQHGALWSPDSARLAAWGGRLLVWEPAVARVLEFPIPPPAAHSYIRFAVWSAAGDSLWTAWDGSSTVYLWSLNQPDAPVPVEVGSEIAGGRAMPGSAPEQPAMVLWTRDGRLVLLTATQDAAGAFVEPTSIPLPGAAGGVEDVVWSPAGAQAVIPLDSGQLYLWRPDRGVHTCSGQHEAAILTTGWRGLHVVTGGADGVTRIWRVSTATGEDGQEDLCRTVARLPRQTSDIMQVAWLDQGRLLTVSETPTDEPIQGKARLWALLDQAGRLICRQTAGGDPECMTYSTAIPTTEPDAVIIEAHWLDDDTVLSQEAGSAGMRWTAWRAAENGHLAQAAMWPEGLPPESRLVWRVDRAAGLIWGPAGGSILTRQAGAWQERPLFQRPVWRAVWLEQGSFWQLGQDESYVVDEAGAGYPLPGLPILVAGQAPHRVAVVERDGTIRVWSLGGAAPRPLLTSNKRALLSQVSPGTDPATVRVNGLAVSPDGRYLAATLETGHLAVWDLVRDNTLLVLRYPGDENAILPLAWHPDRPLLAAAQSRQIWLLAPREETFTVRGVAASGGDVVHLAWQGRPDQLLSQDDETVRLWQWLSEPIAEVTTKPAVIQDTAMSTDTIQLNVMRDELALFSLHEIMRVPHTDSCLRPTLNPAGSRLIAYDEAWGWRVWKTWPTLQALVDQGQAAMQQRRLID